MRIDRGALYAGVRKTFGKLSQTQVDGINAIVDECEALGFTNLDWVAYVLATAWHETRRTMEPVREAFAKTDKGAVTALESAWKRGVMPWVKTPYWRADAAGKCWYGRGLCQLTHRANYKTAGEKLGIDLTADPDQALRLDVAAKILVRGSAEGWFAGKKLSNYFNPPLCDWHNARRIINALESANRVAGYAQKFRASLRWAVEAPRKPLQPPPLPDVALPSPEAETPPTGFWAAIAALFRRLFN